MINTLHIYNELKQTLDAPAAEKIADIIGKVYEELQNTVTKTDFNELKETVGELAESQRELRETVKKLAQLQKEVAEEVRALTQEMKELARAQKRTERTVKHLSKEVGGLSSAFGGDLEDVAYIVLHDVLKREFGWQVGVLERTWQIWGKQPEEVNIFGQAIDPARPHVTIYIVGEAKYNLTAKEVKKFIKQLDRARRHLIGEVFPVCFCYRARPEVQQMVRDAGIRLVFSYGKLV
jgi:hypothetical protein